MDQHWKQSFPENPFHFTHLLDLHNDRVLLSQLTEKEYRQASFLDQRILQTGLRREFVSWAELDAISNIRSASPEYIFHIGHVGSTLISRLLGEVDNSLALREPQILRNLYEISQTVGQPESLWSPETFETRSRDIILWLGRHFHPGQKVIIKASSFVSPLAARLLDGSQKALFLYVPLNKYLPTILAGETSFQECQVMAPARLKRLSVLLGEPPCNLWELSSAKRIALGWLCEMLTLSMAQTGNATQTIDRSESVKWTNFDRFLENPAEDLCKLARHFGLSLSAAGAQSLVSGPIMSSYSKAPEHDYSPALRQQLLQQATRNHNAEIQEAISWVDQLATRYPIVADVMQRVEENV
ncbi:hypothetical protein SAMN02745824_2334 [Parasphingorhabdus marina DSM 22363]|uniref:Sulfotransferase family protein n=1 Tax=Parasphingorhabdus marina DSM 22363 TaxID=1123272 RepID=A0A1N6FC77_9SPHN|nr:hypothetical protein [Parasphingorhabdus marina]SIN92895.1 hypothetical protein SAMN02745824_2334 [Parasphingorhabdus marina DSM 22363]